MMKNQNSLYFAQRGLETCWDFFLEKSVKPVKNLQNRCGPTCLQKYAKQTLLIACLKLRTDSFALYKTPILGMEMCR